MSVAHLIGVTTLAVCAVIIFAEVQSGRMRGLRRIAVLVLFAVALVGLILSFR